jgi:autotransporter-associated beta strand protein
VLGLLVIAGLGLLAAGPAHAQTIFTWTNDTHNYTWDTTSLNWNTGANQWQPNNGTLGAYFGSGGTGTITVSSGIQVGGITFSPGATDILTGGGLTLGSSGITANETATINSPITLGASQTWNIASGKTLTVGALGDAGSGYALTKAGLGTLATTGANTYSGGTSINNGMLQFALTTAMPATGTVSVSSGATLAVNAGGTGEFGNGTSGYGTIGGLLSGLGGQSGSSVSFASGSVLGIDTTNAPGGSLTYSGNITSSGLGFAKLGSGTLTLTGANSYTGGTSINKGALQFALTTAMPATGTVSVSSGATLAVNAGGTGEFGNGTSGYGTIGGLLGGLGGQSGSSVSFASGSVLGIDTTNAPGGSLTYSGNIANSGLGLTKLGTGTLTLGASSGYSGGTTVQGGTLVLASSNGGTPAGSGLVLVESGATLNLASAATVKSNVTAQTGSTLGGPGPLTLSSTSYSLTAGTNCVLQPTLAGTGTTTMLIDGSMTIGNSATFNYNFNGGAGDMIEVSGSGLTLSLTGSKAILNISGNLALSGTSGYATYPIYEVQNGATLTDNVTQNGGTSAWKVNIMPGSSTLSTYFSCTVPSGSTLLPTGLHNYGQGVCYLVVKPAGGTLTWAGTAGGAWDVATTYNWKSGSTAAKYVNYSGDTFPDNTNTTTITITSGGVTPTAVTCDNNADSYTFNGGPITGLGSFTVAETGTAAGTVTLYNTNTYTGPTTVTKGTLIIGPTGSIASGLVLVGTAGTLNVSGSWSGGTSLADSGSVNVFSTGSLAAGTLAVASGGTLSVGGNLSGGPVLAVSGLAVFNANQTLGSLAGSGVIGLGSGAQLTPTTFGAFSGSITGAGGLNYSLGGGTVAVPSAASMSYTGGTTIGGGTLQVSSDGSFGNALGGIQINNATLEIVNTTAYPSTSRTITVGDPNATLKVDSGTFTINNPISVAGSGALTKNGAGTLALAGGVLPSGMNFTATGGGVVDLGGNSFSPGQVTIGPGGSTVQNGTLTSSAGYLLNGPGTITAALLGNGGLSATAGASTLTNTANSYSGGTTVGGTANLSFAAGVTPGPSSSSIVLSGGTLSVTPTGPISLGSGLIAQLYNDADRNANEQQANFDTWAHLNTVMAAPSQATGPLALAGSVLTTANQQTTLYYLHDNFSALGLGNLGANKDNQYFDIVFSGLIKLSAGTYNFGLNSDDGSVLYIKDPTAGWTQIVNANTYRGMSAIGAPQNSGSYTAPATGLYPITIGYYQGGGDYGFEALYQPPTNTNPQYASGWSDIPNSLLASAPVGGTPFGNPVTVTANSTLDVQSAVVVNAFGAFGTLTLNAGSTLTTSGTAAGVSFTNTTLAGGAGSYGFTVNGRELVPGPFTTSGAATIAVGGSGILTLTATTGAQLAGSTFQISNGGTLLAVGQSAFQGAAIAANNGGTLVLAATAASGAYDIMLSSSPNPFTLPATGTGTVLAGAGFGPGGLPGAVLAGANTAATTVTLASTGTLSVGSGQTLGLGSLYNYTLAVAPSLILSTSGGGTILATTGTTVIGSVYSNAADNLAVTSGATLALTASNTMTGTLNVTGGSFLAGNPAAFGGASGATLKFNGGTIGAQTNNLTGANAVPNPMSWGSNPSVNIGGSTHIEFNQPLSLPLAGTNYSISDYNGYSTFSGAISGSGTLYLSGYPTISNANTYTGGTVLNNGCPVITNNQALGPAAIYFANNGGNGGLQCSTPLTGALAVTNAWSVQAGQTPNFYGLPALELTRGTVLSGNVGFNVTYNANGQAGRLQIDGPISQSVANCGLWKFGGGILTLASTGSTYSGGTYLNNGCGNIDVPVSSVVSGGTLQSGPLGTGTLTLNNYNGNGGINIGNYSGAGPVTIANPVTITGPCGYDGGTYGLTFSGPITINSYNANNTNNAPPLITYDQAVTFSGNVSGYQLWLRQGPNWNTGGGLILSGSNSFANNDLISQGTLIVASSAALGSAANPVTLNDGNTNVNDQTTALLIAGSYTVPNAINVTANGNGGSYLGGNTANSSVFSGPITLGKAATLVAASGGTVTFANAITGGNGVTIGAAPGAVNYNGTVVLSGSNSYTGGTTVAYGTLALSGGTIADSIGTVSVNSGATLSTRPTGSGGSPNLIAGAVVVNSGGMLSATVGTPLNGSNTLTMNDGAIFNMIASGSSVSTANFSGLSTTGNQYLQVTALDSTTLSGGSNTFLYYGGNGPAGGVEQGNWTVISTATATWATAGTGAWDHHPNWSGYEVQGARCGPTPPARPCSLWAPRPWHTRPPAQRRLPVCSSNSPQARP